jgi:hypothetical protein
LQPPSTFTCTVLLLSRKFRTSVCCGAGHGSTSLVGTSAFNDAIRVVRVGPATCTNTGGGGLLPSALKDTYWHNVACVGWPATNSRPETGDDVDPVGRPAPTEHSDELAGIDDGDAAAGELTWTVDPGPAAGELTPTTESDAVAAPCVLEEAHDDTTIAAAKSATDGKTGRMRRPPTGSTHPHRLALHRIVDRERSR